MDLNRLLGRHQVALIRAAQAGCVESRRAFLDCAQHYAARIAALRVTLGAVHPL